MASSFSPKPLVLCKSSSADARTVVVDRSRSYASLERGGQVSYARDAATALSTLKKELHMSRVWVDLLVLDFDPELIEPAMNWLVERCAAGDLPAIAGVSLNSSDPRAYVLGFTLNRWMPVEVASLADQLPTAA